MKQLQNTQCLTTYVDIGIEIRPNVLIVCVFPLRTIQ